MRREATLSGALALLVVIAASVPVPARATPPVRQAETAAAQEEAAPQETGGGGLPQDPDTGVLPNVMSDAEEEALRLVEQILEEQQMILVGQNFVYRSEGRRDPFRNILQLRRRELVAPTQRPPGLEGFLISEVAVNAAALVQGRWHVLLTGLDQRTYTATVGTRLYDGRIVSISMNEIVFEQEVEDLLGARSTRQVIKRLNEDQD